MNAALRHPIDFLAAQKLIDCHAAPTGRVGPVNLAALGFVDDREQVAADAVHHRGDKSHGGIGGNSRVDRVAAAFEDGDAGPRADGLLGGDDAILGNDHGPRFWHPQRE